MARNMRAACPLCVRRQKTAAAVRVVLLSGASASGSQTVCRSEYKRLCGRHAAELYQALAQVWSDFGLDGV